MPLAHPILFSPISISGTSAMNNLLKLLPLPLPHFRRRSRTGGASTKSKHHSTLPHITVLPGVLDISKAASDALAAEDAANVAARADAATPFEVGVTTAPSFRRQSSAPPLSRAPSQTPGSPRPPSVSSRSSRRLPVPLPIPPMPTTPSPRPPSQAFDFLQITLDAEAANADLRPSLRRWRTFPLSKRRTHGSEPTLPLGMAQDEKRERKESVADSASSPDDSPITPALTEAFPLPPRATFTKRLSPQALLRHSATGSLFDSTVVSDDTEPLLIVKRGSAATTTTGRNSNSQGVLRVGVPAQDDGIGNKQPNSRGSTSESTMGELLESLDDVYEAFRTEGTGSDSWVSISLSPHAAAILPLPPSVREEDEDDFDEELDTIDTRPGRLSSIGIDIDLALLPPALTCTRATWPRPHMYSPWRTQTRAAPYSFLVERVQSIRSFGSCAPGSRSLPDLVLNLNPQHNVGGGEAGAATAASA
ncbi:hypothetical protein C8F01DRAFT_360498 [Mycena amicta]|nr:hypothetical protein C8F01DRAFT_360498 [Mycena amicta]